MSATSILGIPVEYTSLREATAQILAWSSERESRYVCLANTHMLVEAHDDSAFRTVLEHSDLTCPDGMPVAWLQRLGGSPTVSRVRGPDLMFEVVTASAREGIPIGLYGGRPDTLAALIDRLEHVAPRLNIAYAHAPPFRTLSESEDAGVTEAITSSGARILFVGLGCPKQERWMAAHRDRVPAVMLGVGAAFDFHAGVVAQAPRWMQRTGLEWAHRLASDPRRLWRRYARTNPRFVALAIRDLLFK